MVGKLLERQKLFPQKQEFIDQNEILFKNALLIVTNKQEHLWWVDCNQLVVILQTHSRWCEIVFVQQYEFQ